MKIWGIVIAIASTLPSIANASSGVVHGRLTFYQNQGNYCPETRSCTGAKYLESEYHTNSPVKHARVYLRNRDTSALIGVGTTDGNGYYTIAWEDGVGPIYASIRWFGEHKDFRFRLRTPTDSVVTFSSANFPLVNGTTSASPQERGTINWGNSTTPNQLANAFDGAQRTWARAFQASNRLETYFTGVKIFAFSNDTPRDCPNSCALISLNAVQLDANAAFRPQGRVAHELGHVANHDADTYLACVSDSTMYLRDGMEGWSANSPEYRCAAFEEGMATYLGSVSLYSYTTPEPYYCLSDVACVAGSSNSFSLEASSLLNGGCSSSISRWAITTVRYLWDIYDAASENGFFVADTMQRPFYEIVDTLTAFPAGPSDHQSDEPWDSAREEINAVDGRSATDDFGYNFYLHTGLDDYHQHTLNCDP